MLDLRTPKGTKDYSPTECFVYDKLLNDLKAIFTLHNAVSIDTPTFELRELLYNKYGEESKLIFDLADQGGDLCSLRYDLTVSFARYLASNKIQSIKRYQIGKVFRRDQPSITKGRLREFVQCDFDVAGTGLTMLNDSEIIKIVVECLRCIQLGSFKVKINHRSLLSGYIQLTEVIKEKFNTVCSSLDKLDKQSWSSITEELKVKGLSIEQINKLYFYVNKKWKESLITELKEDEVFKNDEGKKGVLELELLLKYLKIYKIENFIEFDLSLARGLDYYTGIIFEAGYDDHPEVGSVIGGGRYDNLVNTLVPGNFDLPCIGFSVGVSRLLPLLLKRTRSFNTLKVYVASSGSAMLEERLEVLALLWDNNIASETSYKKRVNFNVAMEKVLKEEIPFLVLLGENELKDGKVKVFYGEKKENSELIRIDELIGFIELNSLN